MVLKTPLFLEGDTTTQNADEVRNLIKTIFGDRPGVPNAASMLVTAPSANMTVTVAAGAILIEGSQASSQGYYHLYNDAPMVLNIAAADATNPRNDLVIARVKDSFYSGTDDEAELVVLTGTPSGSPAIPNPTALGYNNYAELAVVNVPANDTSITSGQLTDRRPRTVALGGVIICTSSTRPSAAFEGMTIYETDTDRQLTYTGSVWLPPRSSAGVFICTSSTRPSSPYEGLTIYETDLDRLYTYSGSAWVFRSGLPVMNNLTFQSLWSNYVNVYELARYWKDGDGVVHLTGLVKSSDPLPDPEDRTIAVLPSGFRPVTGVMVFTCWGQIVGGDGSAACRVDVQPTGEIRISETSPPDVASGEWAYLSLSGIYFPTN